MVALCFVAATVGGSSQCCRVCSCINCVLLQGTPHSTAASSPLLCHPYCSLCCLQVLHPRAGSGVWHHRQGHAAQRRGGGELLARRRRGLCCCIFACCSVLDLHCLLAVVPSSTPGQPAAGRELHVQLSSSGSGFALPLACSFTLFFGPSFACLQIERRDYEGMLRASQSQSRGGRSGGAMAGADA